MDCGGLQDVQARSAHPRQGYAVDSRTDARIHRDYGCDLLFEEIHLLPQLQHSYDFNHQSDFWILQEGRISFFVYFNRFYRKTGSLESPICLSVLRFLLFCCCIKAFPIFFCKMSICSNFNSTGTSGVGAREPEFSTATTIRLSTSILSPNL